MRKTQKILPRAKTLLLLILTLPVISACAHKETGPLLLYPGAAASEDYSQSHSSWVFDNDSIRVRLGEISGGPGLLTPVTERLIDKGYVILRMEIENLSEEQVLFDPSRTSFRFKTMGYKKPLDYTDLYEIGLDDRVIAGGLKGFGRTFYDLTETVPVGKRVSKLLVFKGEWDRAKKAELTIKNVYIGEKVIDLTFPFLLKSTGY